MRTPPTVVVLAAGRGSRFVGSSHKLAQRIGEASVLARALGTAVASRFPVVVVTTAAFADEACQSVAARDIVLLPDVGTPGRADLGMGRSIAAGVAARPAAAGWLILPGDMPNVRPASVRAVGGELERHAIAYAQHRGRRGHPVAFSTELYAELCELTGDEGARRLLARYPAFGVELDDPGVLEDVDTAEDLERLRRGTT